MINDYQMQLGTKAAYQRGVCDTGTHQGGVVAARGFQEGMLAAFGGYATDPAATTWGHQWGGGGYGHDGLGAVAGAATTASPTASCGLWMLRRRQWSSWLDSFADRPITQYSSPKTVGWRRRRQRTMAIRTSSTRRATGFGTTRRSRADVEPLGSAELVRNRVSGLDVDPIARPKA